MLSFILSGIRLGFAAGTLPGPLQSYIINTTVVQGWQKSIIIVFSPLVIDAPIIVLIVFILGQLPSQMISLIQIIGGLYLLWIARGAWLQFRAGLDLQAEANLPSESRTFTRGLLMNILSPGPYIFWGTVNGPLLVQALEQSVAHAAVFLVSFYGTFLGLLAVIVLIFDRVRALDKQVTRVILFLTIIMLVWFGITLLVDGVVG